jgi:hypothetical protein
MQVYNALLTYITHPKPKIRKAAQHAVCAILKGSFMMTADEAPEFHPAAQVTANECLEKLTLSTDSNAVLHTLILLKEVVSVFSKGAVKAVCDGLLSLMRAKSHPHLTSCAMQMLFGLFNSRPAEGTLPIDLNARLVSALYDYKPSVNDPQAIVAWLTVQQEALINLASLDANLCLAHLPQFFSEAKKAWTTDHQQVAVAATTAMKAVCNECVKPNIAEFATDESSEEKLKKTFSNVLDGLGYQYHNAWAQVKKLLQLPTSIQLCIYTYFFYPCIGATSDGRCIRRRRQCLLFFVQVPAAAGREARRRKLSLCQRTRLRDRQGNTQDGSARRPLLRRLADHRRGDEFRLSKKLALARPQRQRPEHRAGLLHRLLLPAGRKVQAAVAQVHQFRRQGTGCATC